MFTILNFVFSSIFNFRNSGTPLYPLELLTALLMFQFFSEGTMTGMTSLVSKAQLVTKIYVPRWTIVLGSTMNALFIFGVNLSILAVFFIIYGKMPSLVGIFMFILYSALLYILILAFSFFTAPFFVRFRDLGNIWEVLLSILMYASPIIYPITMMPENIRQIMLLNPFAFIVHFAKQGLISNTFTSFGHFILLFSGVTIAVVLAFLSFRKYEKRVAEFI
jgi:ABC-2 type transport system permease protein